MRTSPASLEARQRLSLPAIRRNTAASEDAGKFLAVHPSGRITICNNLAPKLVVFFIIISGTTLTLLYSRTTYHHSDPLLSSGSRLVDAGWRIWDSRTSSDERYASRSDTNWTEISNVLGRIQKKISKVGLLNFNHTEVEQWRWFLPDSESVSINLNRVGRSITWDVLYPEWIDEEEETEVPSCPRLPEPKLAAGTKPFDLIAVKLPCDKRRGSWSRDVARLHLQISAAKLAVAGDGRPVHVLFVTECFPIPNLFPCKSLVARDGHAWLYRLETEELRGKLKLPIGSCELAVPLKPKEGYEAPASSGRREAYATILHSADVYVCGAIAAAQSLRLSGTTRDLVILVDESISGDHRLGLESAGWKVRTIERIRNPKAERDAYNEWNYSKFRLWQLTDYDKVVFIDSDLLVLRNIDALFSSPEISASGNNVTLFNSGVMVVEPSECTFRLLADHVDEFESYNGGDQGYLNEVFTWWHRVPRRMNFLKHSWAGDEEAELMRKEKLYGADPPELYVLHYLGVKPWLCFRDFDCNWNAGGEGAGAAMREFASDIAHERWWKVHDAMDEELRRFCLLATRQKAGLEWDRRRAEEAGFADGHWRRKIEDPRLGVCSEEVCDWEGMLSHWGETNSTGGGGDGGAGAASPLERLSS